MDEVNNILKWKITIQASGELMRIFSEIRENKKNSGLRKSLKNVDTLIENEYLEENFRNINFTNNELLMLKKLENSKLITKNLENKVYNINSSNQQNNKDVLEDFGVQKLSNLYLKLNHIKWFDTLIAIDMHGKEVNYLHNILLGCQIILPKNILKRNPVLEARCQILRARQENQKYMKMTKNIDSTRSTLPEDTISYQVKAINKQLIAVLQFIFSVAAGFAFGFIGIELIIGNMDFGFRLLLGIICALTIALAEIYFLAKKLNELDTIPEDHNLTKKNQ